MDLGPSEQRGQGPSPPAAERGLQEVGRFRARPGLPPLEHRERGGPGLRACTEALRQAHAPSELPCSALGLPGAASPCIWSGSLSTETWATEFLADVATQHGGTLRHLNISLKDRSDDDPSFMEVFFTRCTRLRTLDLKIDGRVDLPDLSLMKQLRSLTLWRDCRFSLTKTLMKAIQCASRASGAFHGCASCP